jgi:transposase-like protein
MAMAQQVLADDPVRKRRHLAPETTFQMFLEASRGDIPVVEVLRKWGIHSSDLKRIRETVRAGALKEFQTRKNRTPLVSVETVEQLRQEQARLEQTLIEQSALCVLLFV